MSPEIASKPGAPNSVPLFLAWALRALECQVVDEGQGLWQATLPESLRQDWNGDGTLRFRAASNGHNPVINEATEEHDVLPADASSKLFRWTVEHLQAVGPAVHAAPADQPQSLHELTSQLFALYEFPQGHMHLAGCTLQERPIVRLTSLSTSNGNANTLRHFYFWPSGEAVQEELIEGLRLENLTPREMPTNGADTNEVRGWIAAAQSSVVEASQNLIASTIIWSKHAEGKIAFRAADADSEEESTDEVTVFFDGWATLLADGTTKPPPIHCKHSGVDTYNLTTTDDGHIVAAEAVGTCENSGKRMLHSALGKCSVTGKTVSTSLLETCRTSGERVLAEKMVECAQCGQRVSSGVVKAGRCSACRSLVAVRKDDPRIARLLDVYPKLDRWSRWRLAETESGYVLVATSWLRQLLLVVDKQSLEVENAATAGRFLSSWQELPSGEREELLG